MGRKSSMSLVRTMPSTPSVERVRRKNCLPDCSSSMVAILTGAGKCLCRLKTGFWYSGMAESLSSAAGAARGEAASRVAALTKLRRFIGFSIARGIRLRLVHPSAARTDQVTNPLPFAFEAQGGAMCHLLDELFLAEPIQQDIAQKAGVAGELEAGGLQVFRGRLIGSGEVGDRQRIVAIAFDLAASQHHGGKIAALELADDDAVVEGH